MTACDVRHERPDLEEVTGWQVNDRNYDDAIYQDADGKYWVLRGRTGELSPIGLDAAIREWFLNAGPFEWRDRLLSLLCASAN